MKYKQTIIPHIQIKEVKNLRKYVREEYSSKLQGHTVINKHIGLTIYFGSDGKGYYCHEVNIKK